MANGSFFLEYWWVLALMVLAFYLCSKMRGGRRTRRCRKICSSGFRYDLSREMLSKPYPQKKINPGEDEEIKRAMIIA